jgi:hypothetical protein
MRKPIKVDWFRVICDLQKVGFTHEQIGRDVGVSRRMVGYWRDGYSEPLYSNGSALLALHSSVIKST